MQNKLLSLYTILFFIFCLGLFLVGLIIPVFFWAYVTVAFPLFVVIVFLLFVFRGYL